MTGAPADADRAVVNGAASVSAVPASVPSASMNVLGSIGYFDAPSQVAPAYDPGAEAICPVCNERIGDEPRLCRSLMVGMNRSYFFSYHVRCKGDPRKLDEIESLVVSELFDCDEAGGFNVGK